MADREGPIQKAIVQGLRMEYPKGLLFSVPNELASKAGAGLPKAKQRTVIRNIQAKAKRQGMLPGMGDLGFLLNGLFFVFEVKDKGNCQQENQKKVQKIVESNGGVYAVVRSYDDVRTVISQHMVSLPIRGEIG